MWMGGCGRSSVVKTKALAKCGRCLHASMQRREKSPFEGLSFQVRKQSDRLSFTYLGMAESFA